MVWYILMSVLLSVGLMEAATGKSPVDSSDPWGKMAPTQQNLWHHLDMKASDYVAHWHKKASNQMEMFQNNNKESGACIGSRQGVVPTTELVTFALGHASNLQPRGM